MNSTDTISLSQTPVVDTISQPKQQDSLLRTDHIDSLCLAEPQDSLSLLALHDSLSAPLDSLSESEPQPSILENLISLNDCSYFATDSLYHVELPYRHFGYTPSPAPFQLRHDGWSGLVLLLCFFLAANLVLRLRKRLPELLRGVFFPFPGKTDDPLVDDPLRFSTRLVAVFLLSLSAAMVTFTYTQRDIGYYLFAETPYILFGAFLILWLSYFLVKRLASNFVNWIFFRREKIFTFQRAYTFFYATGALLFLVWAVVVVYLPIPLKEMLLVTLGLVFLVKILILFKTYQLFFPKLYGTLHLIVYFCTLELMPLLVLVQFLAYAGWLLEIKL